VKEPGYLYPGFCFRLLLEYLSNKKWRVLDLHQNIKSQNPKKMRKDGWFKQPTILSIIVQGAGVTPEHQISKSEDNEKRWKVKSTNNTLHSAGRWTYTRPPTIKK